MIAEKPDIVVVGSPPGYHCDQAKAALEAGAARHVREAVHDRSRPTPGISTRRPSGPGRQLILSYGWNYRPMVIQAHRMMHEDGGVGDIEHVALHMDSVTRELLSETGDYPGASTRSRSRSPTPGRGPRPPAAATARPS